MDEVLALLFHSVHEVFGLFLHRPDRLFHLVHLVLEPVFLLLPVKRKASDRLYIWDFLFLYSLFSNMPILGFYSEQINITMTNVNESNIQLSGCVASLQVASNIDVVVSDDASDQIRRGDALGPLSGHKHT